MAERNDSLLASGSVGASANRPRKQKPARDERIEEKKRKRAKLSEEGAEVVIEMLDRMIDETFDIRKMLPEAATGAEEYWHESMARKKFIEKMDLLKTEVNNLMRKSPGEIRQDRALNQAQEDEMILDENDVK